MLDKNKRVLFLVESPEKSRHITKIFRDNGYNKVVVLATIGHFTKIKDGSGYWNTGIHPENNFEVDYQLDSNKKDNINKLKEQVKLADLIYIASDLDREGEAIAESCVKFLKIPKSKYKRITYHEITKKAIFEAIEKAHDIDKDLVAAAHSRSILDKMVGYRLSPIARNSVNCKSVGRCQSAALKLIVEREEEIKNFIPENYFDLYLHFIKNKTEFKAKYQGTDATPIKKIKSQEEIDNIFEECKGKPFIVTDIEFKDKKEYPQPPFCTATFQQECASKLGLSVKQATDCAQKLFESGKISYHRTDDTTMDEGFTKELQAFVVKRFGKQYLGSVREGKKDENAQEGHECLRVLDLELTPEKFAEESSNDLLSKVYRIIYNRTIACTMQPAIIAQTTYNIYNNKKHRFVMNSNELKFDGYRCIYNYKDKEGNEEKEEIVKETFDKGEELKNCSFESLAQQTSPKPRYKEASFLKELKDKGIGRPSTYATIIETVLSETRGYCVLDHKEIVPTEKGITLSHFLDKSFPDIISVGYTEQMEKDLDLIACGKLKDIDFLNTFYEKLEESAKKISPEESTTKVCPQCGSPMKIRKGPFSSFYGCTNYPKCKYTESIKK